MKKITLTTLIILILSAGLFAQTGYTQDDLGKYLLDAPGSSLPEKGQEVFIQSGFFSVEYANDDPLGGVDYLVESSSAKYGVVNYSKLIFIFSENIKTRKVPAFQGAPSYIIIDHDIKIKFTGQFLKANNSRGKEVDVPIFITK